MQASGRVEPLVNAGLIAIWLSKTRWRAPWSVPEQAAPGCRNFGDARITDRIVRHRTRLRDAPHALATDGCAAWSTATGHQQPERPSLLFVAQDCGRDLTAFNFLDCQRWVPRNEVAQARLQRPCGQHLFSSCPPKSHSKSRHIGIIRAFRVTIDARFGPQLTENGLIFGVFQVVGDGGAFIASVTGAATERGRPKTIPATQTEMLPRALDRTSVCL